MARRKNRTHGVRAAHADRVLQHEFAELHSAISAWCDGGDNEAIDIALDALSFRIDYYEYEPLTDEMTWEERIAVSAKHLVTAGQVIGRLKKELGAAEAKQEELKASLFAEMAVAPTVPVYAQRVFRRLEAEGIGQPDLHPPSRKLGRVLAEAVRTYNRDRRASVDEDALEEYSDEPITKWAQLPETFAGFWLEEIETDEGIGFEPCPLPPSTDIAYFTPDRKRPAALGTRLDTLRHWSEIIRTWGERTGKKIEDHHTRIWALLLGHRLQNDQSKLRMFQGMEVVSPWGAGKLVRIHVLPPPEDDDDIPF